MQRAIELLEILQESKISVDTAVLIITEELGMWVNVWTWDCITSEWIYKVMYWLFDCSAGGSFPNAKLAALQKVLQSDFCTAVREVYEHIYETVDVSGSVEVRANATAKVRCLSHFICILILTADFLFFTSVLTLLMKW